MTTDFPVPPFLRATTLEMLLNDAMPTFMANWQRALRRNLAPEQVRVSWEECWLRRAMRVRHALMPLQQHEVGPYDADFFFVFERVAVEVDGYQHLDSAAADQRRDAYFKSRGIMILRLTTLAVRRDVNECADQIREVVARRRAERDFGVAS